MRPAMAKCRDPLVCLTLSMMCGSCIRMSVRMQSNRLFRDSTSRLVIGVSIYPSAKAVDSRHFIGMLLLRGTRHAQTQKNHSKNNNFKQPGKHRQASEH